MRANDCTDTFGRCQFSGAEFTQEWIPRITVIEGAKTPRRFWQPGGGYDRNIDDLRMLQSMIDYIHANPVRRDLVQRAVDWEV